MRAKLLALFWVLVLVVPGLGVQPALAQQPAPQSPTPEDYVLGPGDTIEVIVYGEPDLSRTVTVKPDGAISLPLLGEVKAAGKTTTQLVADLTRLYRRYLKAPSVSVTVTQLRVDRIYILGQVARPGEYQLRPGAGIMELLASAGGPTTRADLAKVVVMRGRTEATQLNLLEAFAANKNPEFRLLAGDVLFIPETDRRIVILGQVNRPGAYELVQGQRVSDLVAAAGGLTTLAAPTRGFVVRGEQQIPVDVQKVLAGDLQANIVLLPGDMMVVPEAQNRIAVLGAVNRPGTFALSEGLKVVEAIAQAGGPNTRGNLASVVIVRLEGTETKRIVVNLERAVSGADLSQNVVLQTGDVIFVPEKGFTLSSVMQWLNAANLVRIIFGVGF